MRQSTISRAALAAFALSGAAPPAWAAELVMVEQPGCAYCAKWDAEVAPAWPKTAAGRFAPLRRIRLRAPVPEDLSLDRRPVFTPTFILVDDDGQELGRLEGYPGADFFWPLIERLMAEKAGFVPEDQGGQ
jgi:hypothetical protein